jgi:dCMP deaminase
MTYERPTWDTYFMNICDAVGARSTCDRGRVGTVVTRDNHILATGYAGAPRHLPSCDEVGHEMHEVKHEGGTVTSHCIRSAHAEQNAIIQAARVGVSLEGATIYVRMTPCYTCAKMVVNVGIKRVVAKQDYHASGRTKEIFNLAGVELDVLDAGVTKY